MSKFELRPPRVLLLMSGSIAAFKVAQLISMLVKAPLHAEVEVVRTESVSQFLGDATIEGLTGRRVRHSLWQSGDAMAHIELVRWADLILTAPCTAHTMNRLAHGLGDDLLTTLFLAHDFRKPWLIAPAMNTSMYRHPTTQDSMQRLAKMGCVILPTGNGELACGEIGEGRLLEADELFRITRNHLSQLQDCSVTSTIPHQGLRILITAGGTRVPLDDVRSLRGHQMALDQVDDSSTASFSSSESLSLYNSSTGATGVNIAESLFDQGHQVTLLAALSAPQTQRPVFLHRFDTFVDLESQLQKLLGANEYDFIIHAAAVSDWLPDQIASGKVDSSADRWTLLFRPAPKLISSLRCWSKNPHVRVVGFKLTSRASKTQQMQKIQQIFAYPGVEAVIANELTEWPKWSFQTRHHRIELSSRDEMPVTLHQWMLGETPLNSAKDGPKTAQTSISSTYGGAHEATSSLS